MATLCQVCSLEPAKYRCPSCGSQSCSLACSKSHKALCSQEPAQPSPPPTTAPSSSQNDTINVATGDENAPGDSQPILASPQQQNNGTGFSALENSPELEALWNRYPSFRSRLREIYTMTLEEEWIETMPATYGRGRGRGRGRGGHGARGGGRSRGPWTAGKGFNRGLGRVRKWRESCEGEGPTLPPTMTGVKPGVDDEAFRQFIALVLADDKES